MGHNKIGMSRINRTARQVVEGAFFNGSRNFDPVTALPENAQRFISALIDELVKLGVRQRAIMGTSGGTRTPIQRPSDGIGGIA